MSTDANPPERDPSDPVDALIELMDEMLYAYRQWVTEECNVFAPTARRQQLGAEYAAAREQFTAALARSVPPA